MNSQAGQAQWAPDPFHPAANAVMQDWHALRAYFQKHDLVLDLAHLPKQFAGGLANLNYLVHLDGREYVLRRPPPGTLPPGANDMRREYTILRTLWQSFPAAPRAVHFCEDSAVIGAPFVVMEYRPGLVIGGSLPAHRPISVSERHELGRQIIELLADLHGVEAESVGLSSLGRPEGMLARTVDAWEKRASLAYGSETPAAISRVAQWLRSRLPQEQAPSLLHSDFKLNNIILDPDTLTPHTVIDWDMGTRGDPLVDVGTLLSYWTQAGDPPAMHELAQMPTAEPGFPTRAELLEAYARRTGKDLTAFRFYRVLCMLKLTVVFMQLHARFLRGEVRHQSYSTFGKLAAGLLDFTEEIVSGNAE